MLRVVVVSAWLIFSASAPALALELCLPIIGCIGGRGGGGGSGGGQLHPAPAPLLGAGIPSAIAIRGTLLGARFWRRKKK
jgi:hypothetical protein